jgi:hypothetical protein
VAIAALVLWISTAAIGTYLLATAARIGRAESATSGNAESARSEPVTVSAGQTGPGSASPAPAASPSGGNGSGSDASDTSSSSEAGEAPVTSLAERLRVNKDDRFAPPSLQRERSEPLPGLKELAEFAHPALALIGLAFWVGYVISRDRLMLAIGLGILLGAIAAGLSWFTVNTRAAKRALADGADEAYGAEEDLRTAPLSFTPLVLILHTVGAVLTLLFVVLIVARV